jgi:hypothetical protein
MSTDTTAGAARVLSDLRRVAADLAENDTRRSALVARRDSLMERARTRGVRPGLIAQAAGVSAARVSQVAPALGTVPEPEPEAAVEPAAPATVPRLGQGAVLLSGRATRHAERPYLARVSVFVSLAHKRGAGPLGTVFVLGGTTLADTLAVLPREASRVFVTGTWHAQVPQVGNQGENVRAWGEAGAPGWSMATAGHFTDKGTPTFRWTEDATGRTVEVTSAAGWFGEDASPETCAAAWHVLGARIGAEWDGAVLLSTPATTGRDLWQRTIGPRTSYPTLAQPVRDLIVATSGQGRTEVRPAPEGAEPGPFTYLDGRFMYAALAYGLPVGEPTRVGGGLDATRQDAWLAKRGRWRVTVEVPQGWAHVGILGRRTPAGWDYPATPGTEWETWADAEECRLALAHGWGLAFHEGIVWPQEGKPLTAWRDTLVAWWAEAGESAEVARALLRFGRPTDHAALMFGADTAEVFDAVRTALRAMVLFGIGAFAAGTPTRERVVATADEVPAGAQVSTTEDGRFRYVETVEATPWQDAMAHPEWAATIWARARVRLLEHRLPDGTMGGALHLPAASVVGFRTDAIYLAGDAPDWADDGKPGRFRVKGSLPGPVAWPEDGAALLALREASEGVAA